METQFNEFVNDELGIPPTFVKCLRNDKDVINIDYDWDTHPTEEFSKLLPQPIERVGGILYAKAEHLKLEDSPIPHKAKVLCMVWIDRHMIKS